MLHFPFFVPSPLKSSVPRASGSLLLFELS
nr:MAG TPA: hypothetical protein [Caudoviricetes sp.]